MSWPTESLGAICEIVSGITKDSKKQGDDYREVPYLRVANVQRLQLDLSEVKTIPAKESAIANYCLEPGDILLNEGGDRDKLGRGWIWQGQISECIHQNHVFRARIRNGKAIPKWIAYYANTNEARAYFLATGKQTTNLASISKKNLGALPVPLPPVDIQQSIIAEIDTQLSRLDETVATLQGIQAKLKQARASILKAAVEGRLGMHENAISGSPADSNHINKWQQEINEIKDKNRTSNRSAGKKQNKNLQSCADEKGWIQATVSEIANVQLGRQRSPKDHNGPWMTPYLRAANITWDGFALVDVNSMNFDPSERERFALEVGDILLNEASGSASEVGKPAIWRGEIPDCCFQNTLLRVRTILSLQRWILLHFLADAKSGRFSRSSKGVGIHHLSANTLSAHIIRIPPPEQQERIVAEVDRRFSVLDQVEATVAASLTRCGKLRQAILKRAFGGQLVPAA